MEQIVQSLAGWKALVVVIWLAALFAGERLIPAAPEPAAGRWQRVGRNAGLWLISMALSRFVVLPVSLWAAGLRLSWRPEALEGWTGLLLDLLLLDFLIYWWHRANHVVPLLWRFHEVHHLDQFLDSTSALRFHFGEVLLSALARAAVIIVFDIPFTSVLVFESLLLVGTIFHHSNLHLPPPLERALSRVVVTPSIHWVHHHAVRRDTDSNYATLLSIWDPLFATRSPTVRSPDMPIGVERRPERALPQLLLRPFAPSR